MYINPAQLSPLENFSSTAYATKPLSNLNQSGFLLLGAVSARVLSCVVIPLTAIADGTIHMSCFAGKMCTGVVITPYNTIAGKVAPNWMAPRDLEISSAFIHLMRVVECLFTAAILPFVCLINPDRAYDFMSHRYGLHEKDRQKHIHTLDQQVRDLQQQVGDEKAENSALRAQLFSLSGAEVARLRLEQELTALKMELEQLKKNPNSNNSDQGTNPANPTPSNPTPQTSKIPEPPKGKIPEPPKGKNPGSTSNPKPTSNSKPNGGEASHTGSQSDTAKPLPEDHLKLIRNFSVNQLKKPSEKKVQKGRPEVELAPKHAELFKQEHNKQILKKMKQPIEALIEYLEDDPFEAGWGLDDIDHANEAGTLLKEYCQKFRLDFKDLEEKPLNVSQEQVEEIKKYFTLFQEKIDEFTYIDPIRREEMERQREEHDRMIQASNQKRIAEALEKKKETLLKSFQFLKETNLTVAINTHLSLVEKVHLNAAFERGNKKVTPAYKNFDEFEQNYNELIQRIHSLANEEQIQPLKETRLYQNVHEVLSEISSEFRDKAFTI